MPSVDATRAEELPEELPSPQTLAKRLGKWFSDHQRDLPWRGTTDPYAVWVSEVMLQQTRVETVQRYWDAFLRRFPTIERLASAEQSEVLEAWSGLGYYRRARLLHRGAKYVVDELSGVLPRRAQDLLTVPGIGRYTAGALASIAFDEPAPAVDGNVARVMSRIDAVVDVAQQPAAAARHWPRVAAIVAAGEPRVLTQALMELGATVCTPRSPTCLTCPVRRQCRAHALGLADRIPAPKKRAKSPVDSLWALAVTWRGKLGLVKRPEEGLLASMWCLPLVPRDDLVTPTAEHVGTLLGVPVSRASASAEPVRHVFTHRVWEMQPLVVTATRKPKTLPSGDVAWLAPGQRPEGGIPTVTEKLLLALDKNT